MAAEAEDAINHSAPEAGGVDNLANSLPASPTPAQASIAARRMRSNLSDAARSAAAPVEADETTAAPPDRKRAARDGEYTRRRWRSLIGRHPPKGLSHMLMERILAWREQIAESGDVSFRSRAILAAALAGGKAQSRKSGGARDPETGDAADPLPPRPREPLRAGTALVREHAGVLHRVTATPEGFEWQGRVYASLSAVARAITGVRWSGPRFFALDGAATDDKPGKARTFANTRHKPRRPRRSSAAGDAP